MGECNFYLKARFASPAGARAAVPRLSALLAEGESAYHYWQSLRGPAATSAAPPADQFWAVFRSRFPHTCEYLGDLNGSADWNNGLAGQLGMLVDPQRPRWGQPSASLSCEDDALYLRLNGIWHMSDLHLLERFCVTVLDAVAVGSASAYPDEVESDPDEPFDFIHV